MAHTEGFADRLAQGVADGLDGFRQQDKYYKAQVGILAAWLTLSIATVAAALLVGRTENKLGAEVRAEAPVGGMILLVTNTSDTAWSDVSYTLNGVYVARRAGLGPHDHDNLPLRRFRKGGAAGKRAPPDLVPQVFTIQCDQGQFQTELGVAGRSP